MVDDAENACCRVLISYAHESPEHVVRVQDLAELLVGAGVDVHLDQFAAAKRQDWVGWTLAEMRRADRVLVVASATYRRRFEQESPVDEGRGVQFEALLIREEVYRDQRAALRKFVPVLLPGAERDDIPTLLLPYSGTHYRVRDISTAGAEHLIHLLTGIDAGAGPHAEESSWSGPPSGGAAAAVHLVTTGGTALAADDVVRWLARPGFGVATTEFDAGTRTMGAVVLGSPASLVDALARAVRGIHDTVEVANRTSGVPRLRVRIGAHCAVRPEEATLRATDLAGCAAARRMHNAPDADVVVAASTEFFEELARSAAPYPRLNAFRSWPSRGDSGTPCWLAVPGRPALAVLPAEVAEETSSSAAPPAPAPRFSIGVIKGPVTNVGNDAVFNVVNHFGGWA